MLLKQEFFLQAIRDLGLEQLHAETARLQLSLYHLRRSQVQLEEFRDDPVCRAAIEDNEVVIKHQVDRIDLIRLEVERRGFSMEHGSGGGEKLVNGAESEESLGQEIVMGGTSETQAEEYTTAHGAGVEGNLEAGGEEGVYL